jgi:hypothetical protein
MVLQQLYESLTDHAGSAKYSYAQFFSHSFYLIVTQYISTGSGSDRVLDLGKPP